MAQTTTGIKPHVYTLPPYTYGYGPGIKKFDWLSVGFDFLDDDLYRPSDADFATYNSILSDRFALAGNSSPYEPNYYINDSSIANMYYSINEQFTQQMQDYMEKSMYGSRMKKKLVQYPSMPYFRQEWEPKTCYKSIIGMPEFPDMQSSIFHKMPKKSQKTLLMPTLETIGQNFGNNELAQNIWMNRPTYSNNAYPVFHLTHKYEVGDVAIWNGDGIWIAYECKSPVSGLLPEAAAWVQSNGGILYWEATELDPKSDPDADITETPNPIIESWNQDNPWSRTFRYGYAEYGQLSDQSNPFAKYIAGLDLTEEEQAAFDAEKSAFERWYSTPEYWPSGWSDENSFYFRTYDQTVDSNGNYITDCGSGHRISEYISGDICLNWLPEVDTLEQLPATASAGDYIRVRMDRANFGEYAWNPAKNKWDGQLAGIIEDMLSQYRAARDAKYSKYKQLSYTFKPVTWSSLYIPDYCIRKDIIS